MIPDGVETIWEKAFYDCADLASVVIPDSVREIKSGAFLGCLSLREVTVPRDAKIAVAKSHPRPDLRVLPAFGMTPKITRK